MITFFAQRRRHPALRAWLLGVLAWGLVGPRTGWVAPAWAFNPPTDSAGPLEVRIEGPTELDRLETAVPVRVLIENRSPQVVEGTVELKVIDRWRVEPHRLVPFRVKGKEKSAVEFRVTAGAGSYPAHYPIHALVRFQAGGEDYVAHPILVVATSFAPVPPRAELPWKPVRLAPNGRLALWQIAARRVVVAVFGREPQVMPLGWQGSESQTGATVVVDQPVAAGQRRQGLRAHPPWQKGQVGSVWVEYPVELSQAQPIRLDFANAMTPEGQSDGVTFCVRVAEWNAPAAQPGKVVFQRHTAAKTWEPAQADLTPWAGRTVRIQLESHPGPKHNTGWDSCFWAEPTLSAGHPPPPPPFPPENLAGSRRLGTVGQAKPHDVHVWPGQRGLLDSAVAFVHRGRMLAFRGFEVRVLGSRLDDDRSPLVLQQVAQEPDDGLRLRHRFDSPLGPFDLLGRLWVEQGVLRVRFWLENTPAPRPWQHVHLEDVAAGPWNQSARQVYAGQGNVIRQPGAFRLGFDGHRLSTSFVGLDFDQVSVVQGVDVPPECFEVSPERRHYSLHVPHSQTMTFAVDADVWLGVRAWRSTNGLKAAGGVPRVAGRFVFDLWGGRYAQLAEGLRLAFRYGLTDALAIVHDWQRWGYDYRLPEIFPPNPRLGTLADMQSLVRTCKEAGVLVALHDNYIDFYPDAEGFSYEQHIAFHADGTPVRAWLNESRKAQSYRFRADRVAPFLQRNLKQIAREIAPTAYFIDVWSSIGPYDYWTADGQFFDRVYTRTTWGEHFAWIRDLLGHGAPQISESGHDQLIGWLDGSQANHLRVGKPGTASRWGAWCVWDIPHADAERIAWFDAAHHDRFVQHGAGYPGRYEGGLDSRLHGIYSDDYLSTEVLTAHPPMVSQPFGRDVVRKYWLLAEAMRALALRQLERVEYAEGDLHRQHVVWSGGAHVWVNRWPSDWSVAGHTLPTYGFLVEAPGPEGTVQSWLARRDGLIVEMAQSPKHLYVNGRQVVDSKLPIRLAVQEVRYAAGRLEIDVQWQAEAPIPAGWVPFLHFCDAEGEIVFQAAHQPARFDTPQQGPFRGRALATLPDTLGPDRTLELRAGVYHPASGERLNLAGPDDGTRRIRLGKLRFEGQGSRIATVRWTPHKPEPDPLLARQNPQGKPVDFGPVVTCAGVRLSPENKHLVVTPLPQTPAGTEIVLRWDRLCWPLPQPAAVEVLDLDGQVRSRKPLDATGPRIVLVTQPDAFAYRLGP